MTENEAIKHLQSYVEFIDNTIKYCKDFEPKADITGYLEKKKVFEMEISALKEIQQYRAIGTVEECREAVDKQKPKRAVLRNDNGKLRKSCPVCGCFFSPLSRSCPKCGQAILQENEDE